MPTLELGDDLPLERAWRWVSAHMLFPNEPDIARAHFVGHLIRTELQGKAGGAETTVPIGWLRALAASPSADELVKLQQRRERYGQTAGVLLALIFVMFKGNYDRPSLNKAIHIVEQIASKNQEGGPLPYCRDRKAISAAWQLMRPMAHFWAARELMWIHDINGVIAPGEKALLDAFLRGAVVLHRFGCSFKPSHQSKVESLLDRETSWALPDSIENATSPVESVQIPGWMLEILEKYEPPVDRRGL